MRTRKPAKPKKINPAERVIADILVRSRDATKRRNKGKEKKIPGWISTAEIARNAGVSWNTADKYLKQLKRKDKSLEKKKISGKTCWRLT